MHGLNYAVVRQRTFLPDNNGRKVFLCPQPVTKSKSPKVITSIALGLYDLKTLMTFDSLIS
jgi:hypothetical protein